MNKVDI